MNLGKTIFAQVMQSIHRQEFQRCVSRYGGDYRVRSFSCRDQFLAMCFAQLTFRESLRDIEACLDSRSDQLYHLGFRSRVARSTLAEANEKRDWRIYADLAHQLIGRARVLYRNEPLAVRLDETVYAFDATTIDLSLSVFPWAWAQQNKSAVKINTLLDLRGSIPTFIEITAGRRHEVQVLDILPLETGAFYIMDRGYLDFGRLFQLHQFPAYFVVRSKANLSFTRYASQPTLPETGIRSDQIGRLRSPPSRRKYPDQLRRIHYVDPATRQSFLFLTNHFRLPSVTVALLYKLRWQVELFFRWIKQHLRIKAFYGTSYNAVCTQIWIAICVYVQIAILRKQYRLPQSLHSILQVLSVSAFEKVPIYQLLTTVSPQKPQGPHSNQLKLLDF
ncbi:MAG: IS4 family transposase [bacterium]